MHDDDAFRGDCAFRHLECRRDRAIGKQSFSTAQRYWKYLQPEGIDQVMLEERLNEICASINVQIRRKPGTDGTFTISLTLMKMKIRGPRFPQPPCDI